MSFTNINRKWKFKNLKCVVEITIASIDHNTIIYNYETHSVIEDQNQIIVHQKTNNIDKVFGQNIM
jgi:hypothetical protein